MLNSAYNRKKIFFIGNCQILSLCIYFTEFLSRFEYDIKWICYSQKFIKHLGRWTKKPPCRKEFKCAVELNHDITCDDLQLSSRDILIYQPIKKETSINLNYSMLGSIDCKKIIVPQIFFDKNDPYTIEKMKVHEKRTNIKLSEYILNNNTDELLLSVNHPTTKFFLHIIEKIQLLLPEITVINAKEIPKIQGQLGPNFTEL